MLCKSCGATISDNAISCNSCGANVGKVKSKTTESSSFGQTYKVDNAFMGNDFNPRPDAKRRKAGGALFAVILIVVAVCYFLSKYRFELRLTPSTNNERSTVQLEPSVAVVKTAPTSIPIPDAEIITLKQDIWGHVIGEDVPAGKYTITAIDGAGYVTLTYEGDYGFDVYALASEDELQKMKDDYENHDMILLYNSQQSVYDGIELAEGATMTVSGELVLTLTPVY